MWKINLFFLLSFFLRSCLLFKDKNLFIQTNSLFYFLLIFLLQLIYALLHLFNRYLWFLIHFLDFFIFLIDYSLINILYWPELSFLLFFLHFFHSQYCAFNFSYCRIQWLDSFLRICCLYDWFFMWFPYLC